MQHKEKTDQILKAYYKVYNQLGYGFLEKVYHNAMLIELRTAGLSIKSQYPVKVYYNGYKVGSYIADIVVDNCIIIENKAMETLREEHEYQLINYLRATDIEVGFLLNFGKTPEFKRKYFTNDRKQQFLTGKGVENTD
jgi:GxxExxY protein